MTLPALLAAMPSLAPPVAVLLEVRRAPVVRAAASTTHASRARAPGDAAIGAALLLDLVVSGCARHAHPRHGRRRTLTALARALSHDTGGGRRRPGANGDEHRSRARRTGVCGRCLLCFVSCCVCGFCVFFLLLSGVLSFFLMSYGAATVHVVVGARRSVARSAGCAPVVSSAAASRSASVPAMAAAKLLRSASCTFARAAASARARTAGAAATRTSFAITLASPHT